MDISVEHVLLFLVIVFFLYHLIGNCSCSGNGFSVGGQSVSPTCKCRDLGINNMCPSIDESRKWGFDQLTCTNYTTNASCLHSMDGPESICVWDNELCYPGDSSVRSDSIQYTFDLSSLNLDPKNGPVTYEIVGNWENTANGSKPALLFLNDKQKQVLNCLQTQLNIRYIGVNNKGSMWYDYQVLVGVNPGSKGVDLYFNDKTNDNYNISVDKTSVLSHDTNYNSKEPTIIHLIGYI